LGTSSSFAD
jgi:hypothetical protein